VIIEKRDLIIELRKRDLNKSWRKFILEGGKLEEKNKRSDILNESVIYGRREKDIYRFSRKIELGECNEFFHVFYVLEKDQEKIPKRGIDAYYCAIWHSVGQYMAVANSFAKDYQAIINTITIY
jgi:hypothetical protein